MKATLFSDIFKTSGIAKTFNQIIEKFNPYHDRLGRFSSPGGAASFTYAPGKSKAHDNAIAREKERSEKQEAVITSAGKMASYVVDSYGIETDKKGAVKAIQDCYRQATISEGMKWNEEKQKIVVKRSTIDNVRQTARDIMSRQEYEDSSTSQEYYELHRAIKQTPIKISDYDKANIPDWNEYRKKAFGNMTISNSGISIDSFYQELSTSFPHLFDSSRETSPSDQILRINEVLGSLKPTTYRLTGKDLDDAANDLALQMINGYIAAAK